LANGWQRDAHDREGLDGSICSGRSFFDCHLTTNNTNLTNGKGPTDVPAGVGCVW
jgi:hypothetical protein